MLRRIIGSPLRFFSFLSLLLFIYFGLLFFLDDFIFRFGIATFSFFLLTVSLYTIAHKFNDLSTNKSSLVLLFGSPVKAISFLAICLGVLNLFYQILWVYLSLPILLILILGGTSLYLVDSALNKKKKADKKYILFQICTITSVIIICFLVGQKSNAKTNFIFSENTQKEAIIVYGIEGYPPLPASFLWEKTIKLPSSGLLVTSSLIEELPGYRKNYLDEEGNLIQMNKLFVQEVCNDNDILIIAHYFTQKNYYPYIPFNQSDLQRNYQELYDSICSGKLKSSYVDTRWEQYRNEKPRDQLYIEFLKNSQNN